MLAKHLESEFARKAHYNAARRSFEAPVMGRMVKHCGLVARIKARHYAHHKMNRSKRKHATVDLRHWASVLIVRLRNLKAPSITV